MRAAAMSEVMNSVSGVQQLLRLCENKSAALGLEEASSTAVILRDFDTAVSLLSLLVGGS